MGSEVAWLTELQQYRSPVLDQRAREREVSARQGICHSNKAESLLDANIAKSVVSSLLILTDDWGV